MSEKPRDLARPLAEKPETRAGEQEPAMELLGRGHVVSWSPISRSPLAQLPGVRRFCAPRHDFSYGVCARRPVPPVRAPRTRPPTLNGTRRADCKTQYLEELMGGYANTPPLDVLANARFYQDALLHAPQLELTVMAVAVRDLDLHRLHRCAPQAPSSAAGAASPAQLSRAPGLPAAAG